MSSTDTNFKQVLSTNYLETVLLYNDRKLTVAISKVWKSYTLGISILN